MVDNTKIKSINIKLRTQIIRRFGAAAAGLFVVGSIAAYGAGQQQPSSAASVGILSMSNTGSTSLTLTAGSMASVTLYADSGTDPVNAVQASLNYDATKLKYLSMTEGTAFPSVAANSTGTAGLIRVGRANTTAPVTGKQAVVTVNFKVLGSSGTTSLAYDPAFSFIVSSATNSNILSSVTGLTYGLQLPPPSIVSLLPSGGQATGGTTVTITGTNFVTGATVRFGTVAATNVTVINPTTITVTTPAQAVGTVAVAVTNPNGQAATIAGAYKYLAPPPTLNTISPIAGTMTGGTSVTLSGSNFQAGAVVKFGSAVATITSLQAGTIVVTTPGGLLGTVDVTVINPDGSTFIKSQAYTFIVAAPSVSTVSPLSGPIAGGTTVTITGANFSGVTAVRFGTVAASGVTVLNSTTLTAVTPAVAAAGQSAVSVTNSSGVGAKNFAYTYLAPAPTIVSLTPNIGTASGGTKLSLRGTNFGSGTTVLFGTIAATNVVVVNATTLTAVVPAGAAGVRAVTVTNSDGQKASLATGYTYLALGDCNADGRVNALDLSVVISRDGQNYSPADFNGDGTVGAADLAILLARWTW